ncbi:hypothetical protein FNH05_26940 [Amycolatopsis rhizosphaerae]|uniref:Uncharacterized protein n=1 Tax=Amycolatopsis rhizosphaerae TaxID=2053003 RepID=A0A558BB03_9PSEU|nr:hypothetical protein [Amycolatopsis rhizosphaerae]TVT33691.1 hypothetical protein FNH05_26940 [Amycolatopsis rhizosphaerae]
MGDRTALVTYLIWAIHFFVHRAMLDHLAPPTATLLVVTLGLTIAWTAGLLALTKREPGNAPA